METFYDVKLKLYPVGIKSKDNWRKIRHETSYRQKIILYYL